MNYSNSADIKLWLQCGYNNNVVTKSTFYAIHPKHIGNAIFGQYPLGKRVVCVGMVFWVAAVFISDVPISSCTKTTSNDETFFPPPRLYNEPWIRSRRLHSLPARTCVPVVMIPASEAEGLGLDPPNFRRSKHTLFFRPVFSSACNTIAAMDTGRCQHGDTHTMTRNTMIKSTPHHITW